MTALAGLTSRVSELLERVRQLETAGTKPFEIVKEPDEESMDVGGKREVEGGEKSMLSRHSELMVWLKEWREKGEKLKEWKEVRKKNFF